MAFSYNDFPRFSIGTTFRLTQSGFYTFTGATTVVWTVIPGAPITPRRYDSIFFFIKNRGTAILTVSTISGNFYESSATNTMSLAPGESIIMFWDGTYQNLMVIPGRTVADSSGTPGAQAASTRIGRCSIAAAGTSVTVTNALCTAASIVHATIGTNDTTALIKNVVPGAGSFVVTLNAAATATTNINWHIVN